MAEEARTDWVPRLREDLVVTELPISDPFDGFILSRIDGETSVKDIADLTGASIDRVQELLSRLEGLGALGRPPGPPARATRPPPAKPKPEPEKPEKKAEEKAPAIAPTLYDPRELDEKADLDRERKHEILHAFYRLSEVDYYQLLGISREADKKEIRAAYFRLSKRFHPDTLYGKELGSFKSKMEKVFEHLTRAYETLGKKKRRRSYDEYLAVQDETRAMEESLDEAETDAAEVAATLPEGDDRRELENAQTDRPPAEGADVSAPKVDAPEIPKAPKPPRMTDEERRAMARRLLEKRMGSSAAPPPRSSAPPSEKRPSKADVLKGLKTSLQTASQLTGGSKHAQAQRFIAEADNKEEEGNILGAVNALKMALGILPDREDLVQRHDDLRAQLAAQMAETYLKQARYEEQHENWDAAARSWQKVAEGRPADARAWRQAALALLEAGGDLKLARDLAQNAVELQPKLVANRVALARVYVKAKMKASAKKELEEAVKLDPDAEIVKTLQRELK